MFHATVCHCEINYTCTDIYTCKKKSTNETKEVLFLKHLRYSRRGEVWFLFLKVMKILSCIYIIIHDIYIYGSKLNKNLSRFHCTSDVLIVDTMHYIGNEFYS